MTMIDDEEGFSCDFCGSPKNTRTFVFESFSALPPDEGEVSKTGFYKPHVLNICPFCQSRIYSEGIEPLLPRSKCDKCGMETAYLREVTVSTKTYKLCPLCVKALQNLIEDPDEVLE